MSSLVVVSALLNLVAGPALAAGGPGASPATSWPDISASPPGTGEGAQDAAVIVAIEDYSKVDDVRGAARNADDWVTWLLTSRGVPAQRVFQARDADATDVKIKDTARRAAAAVQPGGTLWFVYIGHGAPSRAGDEGLLVGADADRTADGIYARSVARKDILAILDAGTEARSIVVLDACFSGQSASGATLVDGLQPLIPSAAIPTPPSRTVLLTAASSGEFAGPLPGEARPAFSYLALGALRGWADQAGNRDGIVSATEVRDYVQGALNLTVTGRTQTATLTGIDAPLVPALDTAGPDLAALARVAAIRSGNGEISFKEDDSISRLAAEAKAKEAERTRAEAAQREQRAKQLQDRRSRLDALASDVRAAAARDAASISEFLSARTPPPEAVPVLDAYLARYGEASVKYDGVTERVEVADVARVREAKSRAEAAIQAASDLRRADELRYGSAPDIVAAGKLYSSACAVEFADVALACGELAWFTGAGRGGMKKDTTFTTELGAKSRASLEARCDEADLRACRRAGMLYSNGWGVSADPVRAASLYKKACDGGDAWGCSLLADAYKSGAGVEKDAMKWLKLAQQACDGDDQSACVAIASAYVKGDVIPAEPARGAALFADLCTGRVPSACGMYGWTLETGTGVTKDEAAAAVAYQRGCEAHSTQACTNLGGLYLDGRGVERSPEKAVTYRQQACKDGSPEACDWVTRFSYSTH